MTTFSVHTLMMSIQAVDAQTNRLAQAIDNADDPYLSGLEEEMLDYSTAQIELKKAYIELQQASDNLPPYEELVTPLPNSA